jgi:CTP:molybdopterin cytidylyltransferase MocA
VISGLILAAGEGKRFGPQPKLLVDLGGRPLLEHAIRAHCGVPELDRVVVVLGYRAQEMLRAVDFDRAEAIVCADWADGQASSLRTGVAAVSDSTKVILTLGDQPLISSEIVARFVGESPGTRATYGGRPGHPVVLGPEHYAAIRELAGDRGARDLLLPGRTIEYGELSPGRDVDTPEDLDAIRGQ